TLVSGFKFQVSRYSRPTSSILTNWKSKISPPALFQQLLNQPINVNSSCVEETNSIVLTIGERLRAQQQRQIGTAQDYAFDASSRPKFVSYVQHLFSRLRQ